MEHIKKKRENMVR